jgi:ribosomal protein S1
MSDNSAKDAKAKAKADKAYNKAVRPIYKKKRFWALGVIVIAIAAQAAGGGGSGSSENKSETASNEVAASEPAIQVTAKQLVDELENNALSAKNKYDGKKVVVTGKLSNIDASGDYFSLEGKDFSFTNIQIFIDEKFLDTVSAFKKGQSVTVTGEVTGVGELLGYSIKAISIP